MSGQAATLNNEEWAKLEKYCTNETHKLIWALLRFTGARIGEVLQLTVEDVYFEGKPRESILYRKETRKGHDKNHSVPVSHVLRCYLAAYRPPSSGYLFPSDRSAAGHLTYDSVAEYLDKCAARAGLSHKRVKTHSGRRSRISSMIEHGIDLRTVQAITGHSSIQNLIRYADTSPNRCKAALEVAFS